MAQKSRKEPSQRERQRTATRERLLNAALGEFDRVGFQNSQVDDIAKAAGVVRGTFYHHFSSKDDVLIEMHRRFADSIALDLKALRATNSTLRDVLTRVIEGVLELQGSLGDSGLLQELFAVLVRSPIDPNEGTEWPPLPAELNALFEEAAVRGELRTDLASDQLAVMFLNSIFGVLATRRTPADQRRSDLESLVDVFLKGMSL